MGRLQVSNEKEEQDLSGLQWLSQERPAAMHFLLSFFRESGKHLDPKTRFLISVVTKVVNLSPRGLRQYIPRAMNEGATRDEIIDAILCAYPAAGLTNVVEAIQVFRSLDNGEPELDPGEPEWTFVARVDEIEEGNSKVVQAGNKPIAVFNVDGQYRAISNICLHQGGLLGLGQLDNCIVTCTRHAWKFDVNTGECVSHPGRAVARFDVRIEGDEVQVLA